MDSSWQLWLAPAAVCGLIFVRFGFLAGMCSSALLYPAWAIIIYKAEQ